MQEPKDHPKLKKLNKPTLIEKGWGSELVLFNDEELCGKILTFHEGSEFSMHYHKNKYELFYVLRGEIEVIGINTEDASRYSMHLIKGNILQIPRGASHKIKALEDSEIIEFSTHHKDSDSYRVEPGDSQKKSK